MIIIMKRPEGKEEAAVIGAQVEAVADVLHQEGFKTDISRGVEKNVVGLLGEIDPERAETLVSHLRAMPGVVAVERISKPYKRVARKTKPQGTTIPVNGIAVGGNRLLVIAGPCAAESEEQLGSAIAEVQKLGAGAFRAGVFKPRSSPYSFQGMGEAGLILLDRLRKKHRIPIVTEVTEVSQIPLVGERADVFQVGMRNMQNYDLLRALSHVRKPVLLKRNHAASLDELLQSAEYIARGNEQIILCLRGIKPLQGSVTRNTPDIGDIPVLKAMTHLPVLWDPSHPTGDRRYVIPVALAGVAAGADGLLVEVHPDPPKALSDAEQQLDYEQFGQLMDAVRRVAAAVGRTV